ncbi:hypothetical protein JVU11DRAFT_13048 [Chiua virens]|nr:hypothetical protein JVU11DRAFT_13048 [Chiua virens]
MPKVGTEYEPSHDRDKETEGHDHESTTTTTDSDPPPHTPIGASTTLDCVEGLQVHGDDGVDVDNIEIDDAHAVATCRDWYVGSHHASRTPRSILRVWFPLYVIHLVGLPSWIFKGCGVPFIKWVLPSRDLVATIHLFVQRGNVCANHACTVTPASSVSFPSGKDLNLGDQGKPKVNFRMGNSDFSASEDAARRASPPMNPGNGLRKDPQGFWESVIPVSPSSSSSLPLSPTEEKMGARLAAVGWIGEKKAPVLGEGATSAGSSNSQFTSSVKVGSFSFGSNRSNGDESTPSSSSLSPPATGSAFGPANATTLLPAFLAAANVKRKKTSRTREIVDQLRSSSVDAGKGGVGLEGLGQQASSSAKGEMESAVGKGSSGTDVDVTPGVVSDLAKTQQGQATSVKPSDISSSASGGNDIGLGHALFT